MNFLIAMSVVIAACSMAYADEITLTTYYPAPNGHYQTMSAENMLVQRMDTADSDWSSASNAPMAIVQDGNYDSGMVLKSGISATYAVGIDVSGSENLKINRGGVPGTNNDFVIKRADGNVGVGVASPAAKLDVGGTVKAAGIETPQLCLNGVCRTTWPTVKGANGGYFKPGCGTWTDTVDLGFVIDAALVAPNKDGWTGDWRSGFVQASFSGTVLTLTTEITGGRCDGQAFNWIAVGHQ